MDSCGLGWSVCCGNGQSACVKYGGLLDLATEFSRTTLLHGVNPLNAELNPICYLLALLGAHHFLHVSRIRVKSLILRLLMLYIYIYMTLVA